MSHQCVILIIDDDVNLCRTLTIMLEHAGYAATIANTGQQGLEYLEAGDYDLIMLDIGKLDQDGRDWLPRLRQRCPDIPLLVLIGQDLSGLDTELRQNGANAILYKPVDSEFLLTQVWALVHTECLPNS